MMNCNQGRVLLRFAWSIVMLIAFSGVCFPLPEAYGEGARANAATESKPLPELTLPDLNGAKWRLSDQRGKVVLINFWATWCLPCREETPMLVSLAKDFDGLSVAGIALDQESLDAVRQFVVEYKVPYPVLLPVPGSLLSRIQPVPTTLLIDQTGRLAKKYVGAIGESILRTDIEALLAPAKRKPVTRLNSRLRPKRKP